MGRSNYGVCVECGRKGNRDSANRCYTPKCKAERKLPDDPLEMRDSPILDAEEVAAMDSAVADSGQEEYIAEVKESAAVEVAAGQVDKIKEPLQAVTVGGVIADAIPRSGDHIVDTSKMVADPHDATEPFTLAGIEFEPFATPRPSGVNRVTIRATSIGISVRAEADLGIKQYTHARVTSSRDGMALAIKMSTEPWPGANKIRRENGSASIAAEPLLRDNKHLVGRHAPLEATDVTGWFVVRFGGEAA